jgi:DNA-binding transcriptional ArsR family regulator
VDDVTQACARLVRQGAVPRAELPALEHPDVRRAVEERLAAVGLELASSAYSDHFGVRLSAEACAAPGFDAASNVGLRADACALLVVLWARLVMQKRAATDARQTPAGEGALFPEDRARAARDFTPSVRFETLRREFGHVLGKKTHLQRLLSQLRRLGFVRTRGDVVLAGPFLELGLDGERLVGYVRREVLADLVRGREDGAVDEAAAALDPAARELLAVLSELGQPASRGELARATGRKPLHVSRALRGLVERGLVARVGTRGAARYRAEGGGEERPAAPGDDDDRPAARDDDDRPAAADGDDRPAAAGGDDRPAAAGGEDE